MRRRVASPSRPAHAQRWGAAALGITLVPACCFTSGSGHAPPRPPALVEHVTGCAIPASATDVGVFATASFNLLVDARFDASPDATAAFLDCWRSRGGTTDGRPSIENGNFGDHRRPIPLDDASGGELRLHSPYEGLCEIMHGRRTADVERAYLRCTFDNVSAVPRVPVAEPSPPPP